MWHRLAGTAVMTLADAVEKVVAGTLEKAVLGRGVRLGTCSFEGASRDGRPRGYILDVDGTVLRSSGLKSSVCLCVVALGVRCRWMRFGRELSLEPAAAARGLYWPMPSSFFELRSLMFQSRSNCLLRCKALLKLAFFSSSAAPSPAPAPSRQKAVPLRPARCGLRSS